MVILGIETSCDETSAAVLEHKNGRFFVLSNIVSSQVKLHSQWGGVVPNLAAREHLKNIVLVVEKSLSEAKIKPEEIDLISATHGPGLIPALLIGTQAAKTLSYLWKKPLLGIHHIEGHIYANFIGNKISAISKSPASPAGRQFSTSNKNQDSVPTSYELNPTSYIQFPILCLVVSGGHTQLVLMKKHLDYKIIGQTLDDAAGEAFDKVARILGLGYPGGPIISQLAKSLQANSYKLQASLPRPMINSNNFNFSFSGLKTAVLYLVKKNEKMLKNKKFVNAVCHEFQQATIDVLVNKTLKAAKKYKPKTIMLAGGVSANSELRKQLGKAIKKDLPSTSYQLPATSYCIDNASMIAAAGYFRWNENKSNKVFLKTMENNWKNLEANANLKLG